MLVAWPAKIKLHTFISWGRNNSNIYHGSYRETHINIVTAQIS